MTRGKPEIRNPTRCDKATARRESEGNPKAKSGVGREKAQKAQKMVKLDNLLFLNGAKKFNGPDKPQRRDERRDSAACVFSALVASLRLNRHPGFGCGSAGFSVLRFFAAISALCVWFVDISYRKGARL